MFVLQILFHRLLILSIEPEAKIVFFVVIAITPAAEKNYTAVLCTKLV